MEQPQASREMPRYRCHKEVWALKIKAVEPLFAPPCQHVYGNTTCGYSANDCMHKGSDSEIVPPLGRHTYAPGKEWTYDITDAAIITPEDSGYAPFSVDASFMHKHNPKAGGYFVVYEDGYKSFSPAKAFEDGYTLIA